MDRISNISTSSDRNSIFKVTAGLSEWKYCILHLDCVHISKSISPMAFKCGYSLPKTESQTYQLLVTVAQFSRSAGLDVWTYCILYLVSIFSKMLYGWLSNLDIVTVDKISDISINCCWCGGTWGREQFLLWKHWIHSKFDTMTKCTYFLFKV